MAGLLMTALGTLPFCTASHDDLVLALALVVRGFGMSAANLALLVGAFRGLAPTHIPDAGSTIRILQQLGGSFGTAVLAAVLAHGGFSQAFAWSTVLTFLASLVGLCLPIGVASDGAHP